MKRCYFILFILLTSLQGCKSEFSQFTDEALLFANDSRIDQKEYESLLSRIKSSNEKGFQTFKTEEGKIDHQKVVTYLLKLAAAKKMLLAADNIWQPQTTVAKEERFNINVFLENSGSMNGYMSDPNTAFKNSVYSLLTRLKLFAYQDSLNLFLVNKDDQLLYKNASNDDLEKFKNILNPASFSRISNGRTEESNLNDLIKRCLDKSNNSNLSVFISDCIYSPDKKVADATQYLADQKNGIFLNFATEIRKRDLSVIILQLYGNFKGTYYDRLNNKIRFPNSINRPYYIWFIGTPDQINKLIKSKKLEEIDGGYKNRLVIQKLKNANQPNFKILAKPVSGRFDREDLSKGIIKDASASKDNQNKGLFAFDIAVDFSNSPQNANYFLDTANYLLSDQKYRLSIEPITDKNNAALMGFTHILRLQTYDLKEGTLRIDIVGKTPSWVYASSSPNDTGIALDDSEKQKTFGFMYLVDGVCDAFYPKSETNAISSISIIIKK